MDIYTSVSYTHLDVYKRQGVSTYDLMDTITADMVKVNLLAIGAVFLIPVSYTHLDVYKRQML